MHPHLCYSTSCSLYAGVLYTHHHQLPTMSDFLSSPPDNDDNIIALLLLAMCDPSVSNKTPTFLLMRSEEEMAKSGTMHYSIHCQVLSGLYSTASMMMLCSSNYVGLTMFLPSSYTSFSSHVLIPFLPVGKIRISLLEIKQPRKVGEDTSVP